MKSLASCCGQHAAQQGVNMFETALQQIDSAERRLKQNDREALARLKAERHHLDTCLFFLYFSDFAGFHNISTEADFLRMCANWREPVPLELSKAVAWLEAQR